MNLFHQSPAQSLAAWLDVATRDLVPSAQARIRMEIEAHHAEAFQSHLADGSPEPKAHVEALADLGNPKSAARRFRREYLTTKNAREAALWLKSPTSGTCLTVLVVLVFSMSGIYNSDRWNLAEPRYQICLAGHLLLIPLCFAGYFAAAAIAHRKATLSSMRQFLLLQSMMWLTLGPAYLLEYIATPSGPHSPIDYFLKIFMPIYVAGMFAGTVCMSLLCLRLRKKLLSVSEHDLPPNPGAPWPAGPQKP